MPQIKGTKMPPGIFVLATNFPDCKSQEYDVGNFFVLGWSLNMNKSPFPKTFPDEPQERKKVDIGTGLPSKLSQKSDPGELLQELLAPGAPVFVSTKKEKPLSQSPQGRNIQPE